MHLVRSLDGVIYIDELDLVGKYSGSNVRWLIINYNIPSLSRTFVQDSVIAYLFWIHCMFGMVVARRKKKGEQRWIMPEVLRRMVAAWLSSGKVRMTTTKCFG